MKSDFRLQIATYLVIAQCLVLLGYPIPKMLTSHLMTDSWPQPRLG